VKRYSDAQIDAAMLLAVQRRADTITDDDDKRARLLEQIESQRERFAQIPTPADVIEGRQMMRLFLEAILQDRPARPGTPAERQQRIADRIEARQEKRAAKRGRS